MANVKANASTAAHPAMDMKAHQATYAAFMRWTVRGIVAVAVLLILMAVFLA